MLFERLARFLFVQLGLVHYNQVLNLFLPYHFLVLVPFGVLATLEARYLLQSQEQLSVSATVFSEGSAGRRAEI